MKLFFTFLIVSIITGCNYNYNIDDTLTKSVRKTLSDNNIKVKWYYYDGITNNSADKVEIYKDTSKKKIIEATWMIVDVALIKDTLKLKLFNPSKDKVDFVDTNKVIFGYHIIFDSTGTYEDLTHIPK